MAGSTSKRYSLPSAESTLRLGGDLRELGHAAHYPARAIRAIIVPRLPHV